MTIQGYFVILNVVKNLGSLFLGLCKGLLLRAAGYCYPVLNIIKETPAMRVIAGQAKGTRLTGLKGARVRPTLDRVRESLFSILGHDLSGEVFLDWFAGSGAIGIEALSRGAEKVVFVENNRQAQNLIYDNLEKCRFWSGEGGSKDAAWILLKMEALHAIPVLAERGYRFDIVYIDPPFAEDLYEECLAALAASPLLGTSALVVVEHHPKNTLHEFYGKLSLTDQRKQGDTCLSFYKIERK